MAAGLGGPRPEKRARAGRTFSTAALRGSAAPLDGQAITEEVGARATPDRVPTLHHAGGAVGGRRRGRAARQAPRPGIADGLSGSYATSTREAASSARYRLGHDRGGDLADVSDPSVASLCGGDERVPGGDEERRGLVDLAQVGCGEDQVDPRHRPGVRGVYGHDAGVGVRAPHGRRVEDTGRIDVIHEAAEPLEQPWVFIPADPRADRPRSGHPPPTVRGLRRAGGRCTAPARSFLCSRVARNHRAPSVEAGSTPWTRRPIPCLRYHVPMLRSCSGPGQGPPATRAG
jgi:hypothetical protein